MRNFQSKDSSSRPASFRPSGPAHRGSSFRGAAPRGPSDFRGRQGGQGRPMGQGARRGVVKQYINPARFIKQATHMAADTFVAEHAFADFALDQRIQRNIVAKGYAAPMPIQDKAIPIILEGGDLVGIANTGTGKTAAFALPIINRLIHDMNARVLVMAPTRELAQQIRDEFIAFARGCSLRTALLIGGASMNVQKRDLRDRPRIVIGTPGRIKDHLGQGTLRLDAFNIAVLDEVDRMLDMGFIVPIRDILSRLPVERQALFFSATMEPKIQALIEGFSRSPATVSVKTGVTAENIEQSVVYFKAPEEKIEKLHDILNKNPGAKVIIFDDTKRDVERLGRELCARGFRADALHGNKSQAQRSRALKSLKDGTVSILVATDVAARGIDVAECSHVINFSVPSTYEDYVHRIGRAGRAGKSGLALTFVAG
jgi:ATP-dependent RNA helicase RhlE